MTFTEWINTQDDICSKLREQGYEEKDEIRKFFNDRIRCILNTHDIPLKNLSPKRSYERIFQINRDNERKWFFPELFKEDDEEDNTEAEEKEKNKKKRKYNPLDSDIEFGEREQEFFKKIVELFPTSEELKEIEKNQWEVLSIEERQELFNIVEDMLENNKDWIPINYSIIGWKRTNQWEDGFYRYIEDEIEEKLLFPRMYRIRNCLSYLMIYIDTYAELSGKEFIKVERTFEEDLDRYVAVVEERAGEDKFANRVNKKIKKVQQLRFGLNQEGERVIDVDEVREEDRIFEADLDRYLNILDERKNGNTFVTRIKKKIEYIGKAWRWYNIEVEKLPEPKIVGRGKLQMVEEVKVIDDEEAMSRYYKIAEAMELDYKEDDIFEKKLKKFERFVENKVMKLLSSRLKHKCSKK